MYQGERTAVVITQKIAAAEGVDPLELPPLYDELDADALNAIIQQSGDSDLTVTFSYEGYLIRVDEPNGITIPPHDEETETAMESSCD